MEKAKQKPKNPFFGAWHTVSMSTWDDDYLNEQVPPFIEFRRQPWRLVSVRLRLE